MPVKISVEIEIPVQGFVQDDEDRGVCTEIKPSGNLSGDAKEADLYVCELRRIKSIGSRRPSPCRTPARC